MIVFPQEHLFTEQQDLVRSLLEYIGPFTHLHGNEKRFTLRSLTSVYRCASKLRVMHQNLDDLLRMGNLHVREESNAYTLTRSYGRIVAILPTSIAGWL